MRQAALSNRVEYGLTSRRCASGPLCLLGPMRLGMPRLAGRTGRLVSHPGHNRLRSELDKACTSTGFVPFTKQTPLTRPPSPCAQPHRPRVADYDCGQRFFLVYVDTCLVSPVSPRDDEHLLELS